MGCGQKLKELISMGFKQLGIYIFLGLIVARVGANNLQVGNGSIVERLEEVKLIRGILVIHYTIDLGEVQSVVGGWKEKDLSYWDMVHGIRGVCSRYLDQSRKKRGLLNVGGEILHVLFGTATDEQVGKIKDSIQIQSVQIRELHEETSNLQKDLDGFREAMRKETKEVEEYQLVQRVISICHSYDRLLDEARTNQVDLGIFNKTKIRVEMEKFEQEIGFSPAVSLDDPLFRQSVRTSVARGKHILISIFFTDAKTFVHYRIRPLPMFGKISNDFKFEVMISNKDVYVNLSREEVGFPSQHHLDHCISMTGASLCGPLLISNIEHTRSCEVELIVKNSSNLCEFTRLKSKEVRVIRTGETLVVSGEPGLMVHAFCKGKSSFVILPGSGVAMFGGHCSIQSNVFRYPNMEKRDVTLTLKEPQGLHDLIIHHQEINDRLEKLITPHHENLWITGTPQEKFNLWGTLSALSVMALLGGVVVGRQLWLYVRRSRSPAGPSVTPPMERVESEGNIRSAHPQGNASDPSERPLSSGGSAQLTPTQEEGERLSGGGQETGRREQEGFRLSVEPRHF